MVVSIHIILHFQYDPLPKFIQIKNPIKQ